MKLKRRLDSFNNFISPSPVLEEVIHEEIEAVNEAGFQDFVDTMGEGGSGYEAGKAYGKAFTAAVIGGVVLMIAIKRAKARLEKKKGLYKKMGPQRFILEADKRLVTKRLNFNKEEQIKKLIGSREDKVKKKFGEKRAAYAAKAGKSQEELEKGDSGFAAIVAKEAAAIKALTDAATEKLKRVTDKETLDITRKLEDWDAKWKKVEEKLDPSSLFDGVTGGKGLGGVKAAWAEWKVQADRKFSDAALKYEFKQYDEYIEDDENLKKIKKTRMDSHQKFIEDLNKRDDDIKKRVQKYKDEDAEVNKEEEEINKDDNLAEAMKFLSAFESAKDDYQNTVKALISDGGYNSTQNKEVEEKEKVARDAKRKLGKEEWTALSKDADSATKMSNAPESAVDEIGKNWQKFKDLVEEEKKSVKKDIDAQEAAKAGVSQEELKKWEKGLKELEDVKKNLIKQKTEEQTKLSNLTPDMQGSVKQEIARIDGEIAEQDKEIAAYNKTKPKGSKEEAAAAEVELAKLKYQLAKLNKEGEQEAEDAIQAAEAKLKSIDNQDESLQIKDKYIILENKNRLKNMKKLISLNEWVLLKESGPTASDQSQPTEVKGGELGPETNPDLSIEIDNILDKLKDLENGLNEEAEELVMEGPVSFIKDYMRSGKVKGLQTKANGLKKKKAKMEVAKVNAEDPAKKEKIADQLDGLGDMIKSTEGEIDDIADNAGPFSSRIKSTLRAKGNLEVIKIKLKGGIGGDSAKDKVKELQQKLADSQQKLKDLADQNQEAIDKAKEKKKDGEGQPKTEKPEGEGQPKTEKPEGGKNNTETETGKNNTETETGKNNTETETGKNNTETETETGGNEKEIEKLDKQISDIQGKITSGKKAAESNPDSAAAIQKKLKGMEKDLEGLKAKRDKLKEA